MSRDITVRGIQWEEVYQLVIDSVGMRTCNITNLFIYILMHFWILKQQQPIVPMRYFSN